MTDIRANKTPLDTEDRLPWLEAVEDDEPRNSPSALKMALAVVIGLVAIGLIVGGLFWMSNRETSTSGEAELIAAPEGDYKDAPADPGGMKVEGEGDTVYAASEGADTKGAINLNAAPEAPVAKVQPAPVEPTPAPAPKEKATPAPAPTPKAAAPVAGGATIQLGAFSSQSGANAAWKALSGRFTYLAPLTQNVASATVGGKTLYRLRASGPNAANLCGRLRVAGESCVTVN
jgi:cell division septation protein DedD